MIEQIAAGMLRQLRHQIERLTPEQYKTPLSVLNGAAIGAHSRHIIEFYQCLLDGLETGTVCYDRRKRNLQIELNQAYTLELIDRICEDVIAASADATFSLEVDYGTGKPIRIVSDFAREAVYMIEHAVHHHALIRIGIQEHFPEVPIKPEFGMAYSTLEYRRSLSSIDESCAS